MNLLRIFDRHPHDDLSAYADGQLGWKQGERLERHLGSCAACSDELAGLRALRAALSGLPEARVPRSFALTPEQVSAPARERQYAGPGPAFIAMRVAGAGVAAVLALVVIIDSGGGGSETGGDDGEAVFMALESDDRSGGDNEPPEGGDAQPEGTENFTVEATMAAAGAPGDASVAPADGDAPSSGGIGGALDAAAPTGPDAPAADEGDQYNSDLDTEKSVDDSAAGEDGGEGDDASAIATGDDDGISTFLVIEIALGIVAAGAILGGFVLPRFVRKD